MKKPKWQEKIKEITIHDGFGTPLVSVKKLIPIIAEEMQKQREELIEECIEVVKNSKTEEDEKTLGDNQYVIQAKAQAVVDLLVLKQKNHE